MKKILGYLILSISVIIFIAVFSASITILKEILKVFATKFETEQVAYTITLIIGVLLIFFFAKFLWKSGTKLVNNQVKTSITLEDGKQIIIPKKVIKKEVFKNFVVILSDPYEKNEINYENVFCYDFEGKQLWQIEDLKLFHESHDYTSIYMQNAEFYLYNRCGVEVKVNPETGEVLSKELIR